VKLVANIQRRFSSYLNWVSRWRSLPVKAWIDGAEFYQRGDFQKAAESYKRGLNSYPNNPARANALLDLSHCLFRLRRFEESENYLKQLISHFPTVREGYIRLARLQLWLGYAVEALWTMRVCVKRMAIDPEIVTLFVTAVVESKADSAGIAEAQILLKQINCDAGGFPRLEVARARLELFATPDQQSRDDLARLAALDRGPFEAVVAFAEVLISEGKLAYARHHLHRALAAAPEHPKVLRLLARSYLNEGPFYEPDYAVQLALQACQVSGWKGLHETFTLGQAYVAAGDKVAALLAAMSAKRIASRLLGGYPDIDRLERLLQGEAVGPQAQ
jgi:tetratricopeptide (TPR) repeat protein